MILTSSFQNNQPAARQTSSLFSQYQQEWRESNIPDILIAANLNVFHGQDDGVSLIKAPEKIPRLNNGRITRTFDLATRFLEDGGWWVQGFDSNGNRPTRYRIKPQSPRINEKGKPVKYESTWGEPSCPHYADIPLEWADQLIQAEAERIFPSFVKAYKFVKKWEQFKASWEGHPNFAVWAFAKTEKALPIDTAEGEKKALSVIGQYRLCIGLSGIYNWSDPNAETYYDKQGRKRKIKALHPGLKPFFEQTSKKEPRRQTSILFDEDEKPTTQREVDHQATQFAKQLSKIGTTPYIVCWDSSYGKGIDDVIFNHGGQFFWQLLQKRFSLSAYEFFKSTLSHVDLEVNEQFLSESHLDTKAKLVAVKGAKGTGKTEAVAQHCKKEQADGTPIFFPTFQKSLATQAGERLGIDTTYNIKTSELKGLLGLATCVDSMHSNSSLQFNPANYYGAVVVIDEAKQLMEYLLTSTGTELAKHREEILGNFQLVLNNAKEILLLDADLNNDTISFYQSLIGYCSQKVIVNHYQPSKGRECYSYPSNEDLMHHLINEVNEGNLSTAFICSDSQKPQSNWGTINLETRIKQLDPEAKILRLDKETTGDPENPAYAILHLPLPEMIQELRKYGYIISSPVVSTGFSIDIKNYFDAIFAFMTGTQGVDLARQFLQRVRDYELPIHAHFAPIAVGKIGHGETSAYEILKSNQAQFKRQRDMYKNIEAELIEEGNPQLVSHYARAVAHHNLGCSRFREITELALEREGFIITHCHPVPLQEKRKVSEQQKEIRDNNYNQENQEICQSESPSPEKLEKLEQQMTMTKKERQQHRKGKLEKKYGVEVTQELLEGDDKGLYSQLRLQEAVRRGTDLTLEEDEAKARNYVEKRGKEVFTPDFNRTQLAQKVHLLKVLGIEELMALEGEITNESLQWWQDHLDAQLAKYKDLKACTKQLLGITLSDHESTVRTAGKLLKKVGMRLEFVKRQGHKQNRRYVHRLVKYSFQDEVLAYWEQQRNQKAK
ncbi:MAG: plasmid replication protein, CyRepA1 family [Halothece sp.]